jgi:hypothetical protein
MAIIAAPLPAGAFLMAKRAGLSIQNNLWIILYSYN